MYQGRIIRQSDNAPFSLIVLIQNFQIEQFPLNLLYVCKYIFNFMNHYRDLELECNKIESILDLHA